MGDFSRAAKNAVRRSALRNRTSQPTKNPDIDLIIHSKTSKKRILRTRSSQNNIDKKLSVDQGTLVAATQKALAMASTRSPISIAEKALEFQKKIREIHSGIKNSDNNRISSKAPKNYRSQYISYQQSYYSVSRVKIR